MRKTKRGARKQVRVVEVQEEAALTPNSEGEKELAIPRAETSSLQREQDLRQEKAYLVQGPLRSAGLKSGQPGEEWNKVRMEKRDNAEV